MIVKLIALCSACGAKLKLPTFTDGRDRKLRKCQRCQTPTQRRVERLP